MTPLRTCVGCRRRHPQKSLLRLCRAADGRVVAVPPRRPLGRSAYLCPRRSCLTAALRQRAVTRALAVDVLAFVSEPVAQWIDGREGGPG